MPALNPRLSRVRWRRLQRRIVRPRKPPSGSTPSGGPLGLYLGTQGAEVAGIKPSTWTATVRAGDWVVPEEVGTVSPGGTGANHSCRILASHGRSTVGPIVLTDHPGPPLGQPECRAVLRPSANR
jgi:hypothetical protein